MTKTDNLNTGKADVSPDAPAHTAGIDKGGAPGSRRKQPGHLPDGRRSAEAVTGVNPGARNPIDPEMPFLSPG